MPAFQTWTRTRIAIASATRLFLSDMAQGLLAVSHNSLAVLGLVVLSTLVVLAGRADVRGSLEDLALDWLLTRQEARFATNEGAGDAGAGDLTAIDRATAADPSKLSRQQAAVAQWLSRRYRVAPEPVSALVEAAWDAGRRTQLEPTLILAIVAIESSFNPFAQSPVGAQGLMQVMTNVHDAKYEAFGGTRAAFDPLTNLRVGVDVLVECIRRAGGSIQGGLRLYVGAGLQSDDGGYATRVFAEEHYLRQVAQGRSVPVTVKLPLTTEAQTSGAPKAPATSADMRAAQAPAASHDSDRTDRLALLH